MATVYHIYFGSAKGHPIIRNYLKSEFNDQQVIDCAKNGSHRLRRLIFHFFSIGKLRVKCKFNAKNIIHTHDIVSFYFVRLFFPLSYVIFDSHEVYNSYFSGISSNVVRLLEEFAGFIATVRVFPSIERKRLYRNQFESDVVIENLFFPDDESSDGLNVSSNESDSRRGFQLVYAGLLSSKRMISELIDIVGRMSDVTLDIYGQTNKYFDKILESGLPINVQYKGYLEQHSMLQELSSYDAALALYQPSDLNNLFAAPTKVFENEYFGLNTILFRTAYVDRLVKEKVLNRIYLIDSLSVEELYSVIEIMKTSDPGLFDERILWQSQIEKIRRLYQVK